MENTQQPALGPKDPRFKADRKENRENFWVDLPPAAKEESPGLAPRSLARIPRETGPSLPFVDDPASPAGKDAPPKATGQAGGPADTRIQRAPLYGPGSIINTTDADIITYRMNRSHADPQGSWTGVPEDPGETPAQDADDL